MTEQQASNTLMPSANEPTPGSPPRQPIYAIFAALLLVMLLASLDQTIVLTALPTIVGDFGGIEHLSWIVTAYMLATTVVTPLYGKLGDLFGRKIVLQSAIILFLIGSALCGMAQSMGELIIFRAIQGLGGGGLMVTSMAVVGDIISPRERGRYQGVFGGVYGFATILGPLIGGYFVEHLSWRWIFYVNLPLGVVALAVIGWAFTAPAAQKRPKIDVAGAALMAAGLTSVMLITSLGGHTIAWDSAEIIGLIAVAVTTPFAFIWVERRAAEPILPLSLFANRTFVTACAIGFIVGVAMFGPLTFMPVYLQVVNGMSPSAAGLQLTPMMGGVLLTSIVSGQIITRIGRYRIFPILGTAIMTLGLFLLSTLNAASATLAPAAYMLVLGLGLGMVIQVLLLAVQNAVDYAQLGVATSGTTLFRTAGGSVGVAVFGAIFAASLVDGLAARFPDAATLPDASDPAAIAALNPTIHSAYLEVFAHALHPVFLWATGVAIVGFLLSWLLDEVPLRGHIRSESIGESFAVPRDVTSLDELTTIVEQHTRTENRWATLERINKQINADLAPDEMWLLAHICRDTLAVGIDRRPAASAGVPADITAIGEHLVSRGLARRDDHGVLVARPAGRERFERISACYRQRLAGYVERWAPEERGEVRNLLTRLARELLAEFPSKRPQ